MATISTAMQLQDRFTSVLTKSLEVMSQMVDGMEALNQAGDNLDLDSNFDSMRESLALAGHALEEFGDNLGDASDGLRDAADETEGLAEKVGALIKAYASFQGLKMGAAWVKENLALSDIQRNAERQLQVVLANVGATEEAFDALKATASEIQGYSLYGDEAMLGGAAEFATYMSDTSAIESMMGTLADYAAGMSGGGAINTQQMVDYATQLGKALNGSYDGLTKKGFALSDAQKEIIENGTDMEKALVLEEVIGESWEGLAEAMANTPDGQVIQFTNLWGDFREELGNRLYPAVLTLFDAFNRNFPQAQSVLTTFADVCSGVIYVMAGIADAAGYAMEHFSWLVPLILGVAAALGALIVEQKGYAIALAITEKLGKLAGLRAAVHAAFTEMQAGATLKATMELHGMNAALLACPLTWIILLVIAFVAVIYTAVSAINHFAGTSISATGVVAGAFATLGAHVLNTFVIPAWNSFAMLANFFGNLFNDPVAAVQVLFYDMCLAVLGYIRNMASAIEALLNKIPGVTVDITGGLDSFYNKLEEAQQAVKDESGWIEYVQKLDYIDLKDAAAAGYRFGESAADRFSFDQGLPGLEQDFDFSGSEFPDMSLASGTKVGIEDESLEYLSDIAEMRVLQSIEGGTGLHLTPEDAALMRASAGQQNNIFYVQYDGGGVRNDVTYRQGEDWESIRRQMEEESQNQINTGLDSLEEVLMS